jgi:hypothetical protein
MIQTACLGEGNYIYIYIRAYPINTFHQLFGFSVYLSRTCAHTCVLYDIVGTSYVITNMMKDLKY